MRVADEHEQACLDLLNALRAERGLVALRATPLLNQVAYAHARDMGEQGYFDHTDRAGRSSFERLRAAGYRGGRSAENIAGGGASAAEAFAQWRSSPAHLAAMLFPAYRAVGIGRAVVAGSPLGTYWTTLFGDYVDDSTL